MITRMALTFLMMGAVGAPSVQAQDATPGKFDDRPAALRGVRNWNKTTLKSVDSVPPSVVLPDTEPPVPAPPAQPGEMRAGSQQIGYTRPFDSELLDGWPWRAQPDGSQVARVELYSHGAVGLRLRFRDLHVIRGLELRVYNPDGRVVFGPFISPARLDDQTWWTPTIFGERIGIELYAPPGSDVAGGVPAIIEVAYINNCACALLPGSPLACHNDITCFPSFKNNEGRGVARISYVSTGACFGCTGALLNREPGDFSPLFMTANHCVSTTAEADSVELFWFYETQTCPALPGDPGNPNTFQRSFGALPLKRHSDSDWSLLGLYQPPVGDFFLGWNSASWGSGDSATGIHHPKASFKRISFGTSDGSTNNQTFCDPNNNCIDVDVWDIAFTDGTTEGGSSGSPILDSNRRVRGTLSGGLSGCAPRTAFYGRFDDAYTNLRYYLGNAYIASPVFVLGIIGGDPGNNGNSERGSDVLPFNTVYEASFAVRDGDDLRIRPGTYNEQFTIWRPMRLTRWGASGTVTIGQ